MRRDADVRRGLGGAGGSDDTACALGVARRVERQEGGEVVSRARVDEIDAGEVPARDPESKLQKSAVRRGDFEADAFDGDGAVAASLLARDLGPEGAPERVGARAFATDAGSAHVSREGTLANLGVLFALVLFFDACLRAGIEQVESELGLALEHGQKASLALPPERFRFSVLV